MLQSTSVGKPLQIRDVPEPILETLRERAETEHMSLAAYARRVLERHVETRTMAEIVSGPRLRKGAPLKRREILDLVDRGRR
jgi:hypothetical protein